MSTQPPVRRGSDGRALPTRWMIYQLAFRQTWVGEIDAATEAEAVKRAAEKFNLHTAKLMAVRRSAARSYHNGPDMAELLTPQVRQYDADKFRVRCAGPRTRTNRALRQRGLAREALGDDRLYETADAALD